MAVLLEKSLSKRRPFFCPGEGRCRSMSYFMIDGCGPMFGKNLTQVWDVGSRGQFSFVSFEIVGKILVG